jgi:hypothetical protein
MNVGSHFDNNSVSVLADDIKVLLFKRGYELFARTSGVRSAWVHVEDNDKLS